MEIKKTKEMDGIFPIIKMEKGFLLSARGDVTAVFQMELPEIFTLDAKEYESLRAMWTKALRLLPGGTVFHKQDRFLRKGFRARTDAPETSFLDRSSGLFFHERPYLHHRCYLMVTFTNPSKRPVDSALSNLLAPGLLAPALLDPVRTERLENILGQFRQVIEDAGRPMERLGEEELLGGRGRQGLLESYLFLGEPGKRPLLSDIDFRPEFRVGRQYVEMYTLCEPGHLPGKVGGSVPYENYSTDRTPFPIGQVAHLGQLLPYDHIYNQFIAIEDKNALFKKLESRALRMRSLAGYSRENQLSEAAIQDYLNECIAEGRLPVRAHFNLMAWTGDRDQLKEIRNAAGAAFARLDAVAKEESTGAPQLYWAGIPGNAGALPANETFLTFGQQAACLFNMETAYLSSPSPFGIRLGDRQTGKPVHVDISDEPIRRGWTTNRNKFILGPSGSGKSFFTNHMVRSYYERGSHVVLVDVGHSYKGLCELLKGYYFTYREESPIRFNPFYLGGRPLDTEKKESIKTLLLALWKKDDETFTRSEYVAISNALGAYYEQLDGNGFACFDTFYEFLKGDFSETLKTQGVKEKDFDIGNFLYVLRPYYRGGEFDYLLNARENLDLLEQRFIVFELDNIKDHPILFPVVTLIIMEIFISKMRKLKGVRKMILIEEAWKAIAREGMAEYIKYLFKTVRKFFGEAVVVTQEVEDIISSPVVRQAIVNNSDCKILLDQSKYRNKFDGIQELLGLTEKDRTQILSINRANEPGRKYKEVFIGLGHVGKVYRTEVSPEEYLAYTTEETEKIRVSEHAQKHGGNLEKGIRALAAEGKGGTP